MRWWSLMSVGAIFTFCHVNGLGNKLVGVPTVDCESSAMRVSFVTAKPFVGRVYVQGRSGDSRCSRNFAANSDQTEMTLVIGEKECGMNKRVTDKKSTGGDDVVTFALDIVISFHDTFETPDDRAFKLLCALDHRKQVKSVLDVSPLTITQISGAARLPACTYTIHQHSEDGEMIRYAEVGDRVVHVWSCPGDTYGMLVHSCYASDGHGGQFQLLDSAGCVADPIIQPNIRYVRQLNRASAETRVYRFSDKSLVEFQCDIELCRKSSKECDGVTPPQCDRRLKRAPNSDPGTRSNVSRSGAQQLAGQPALPHLQLVSVLLIEESLQERPSSTERLTRKQRLKLRHQLASQLVLLKSRISASVACFLLVCFVSSLSIGICGLIRQNTNAGARSTAQTKSSPQKRS